MIPVQVTAALIGALAGGLASLSVNEFRDWWRIKRTTSQLSFRPERRAGSRATARVKNDSNYALHNAVAYVTINHDMQDLLPPPKHFAAFIKKGKHERKLQEDRLCWSVAAPDRNPISVNVLPGEWQLLDIADFGERSEWVEIPSEMGWSSSQTEEDIRGVPQITSRVFLRAGKIYSGSVKIVSEDSRARIFGLEINPSDPEQPLKLTAA
jgi:hypothetical protein